MESYLSNLWSSLFGGNNSTTNSAASNSILGTGTTGTTGSTVANALTGSNTGTGNFFDKSDGFGLNANTLGFGISALSSLGNLWNAFQQTQLANKQYDLTKELGEANLANSVKSYNTTLSDTANARGKVEGQTQDQIDDYISKNSLST